VFHFVRYCSFWSHWQMINLSVVLYCQIQLRANSAFSSRQVGVSVVTCRPIYCRQQLLQCVRHCDVSVVSWWMTSLTVEQCVTLSVRPSTVLLLQPAWVVLSSRILSSSDIVLFITVSRRSTASPDLRRSRVVWMVPALQTIDILWMGLPVKQVAKVIWKRPHRTPLAVGDGNTIYCSASQVPFSLHPKQNVDPFSHFRKSRFPLQMSESSIAVDRISCTCIRCGLKTCV